MIIIYTYINIYSLILRRIFCILFNIIALVDTQCSASYGGFIETLSSIYKISLVSVTGNLFSNKYFFTIFFLFLMSDKGSWLIDTWNNSGNGVTVCVVNSIFFIACPNTICKFWRASSSLVRKSTTL